MTLTRLTEAQELELTNTSTNLGRSDLGEKYGADTKTKTRSYTYEEAPEQKQRHGITEPHEYGPKSNQSRANAIGAFTTPALHDWTSNEAASEASDREDDGQKGEREVGHWYAGNQSICRKRPLQDISVRFACQDGLDLVQDGNMVAILD